MKPINTTLHQAMVAAAQATNERDANKAIYDIQTLIGQDDGGLAGQHFSGSYSLDQNNPYSEWYSLTQGERFSRISAYVQNEICWLTLEGDRA
ncbi:hypothetical protein JCM19235_1327 [Vibrio maritimus]|uniref:Uncharacterized protein n=1 Tax=Vibrio maritimus TaxID=990268 RepID=A0A090S669_9VIBR|nr:hypothetical protein JCM19235_1327 [Vibrio maritimus]